MPAHRSYTDEQNDRMREVVTDLVQRFGNQRKVAEALGISQPALSAFVLGKYGVSPVVAHRIAELAGTTEEEMLSSTRPKPSRDEYPNREAIVDFARRAGHSDAVIARLRAVRTKSGRDCPAVAWNHLLVLLQALHDSPFDEQAIDEGKRRAGSRKAG